MQTSSKSFFNPGMYQYLGSAPDPQFYMAPLPSPPLSTGSPSSCTVGDLCEDSSTPRYDILPSVRPLLDLKLSGNSLYDIPLQQLVSSLSAPASDNSISVSLAGCRPARSPSWEQPPPIPQLPTFPDLCNPSPLPDLSTLPDLSSLVPTTLPFMTAPMLPVPAGPCTADPLIPFPAATCSTDSALPPLMFPSTSAPAPPLTCPPPTPCNSPAPKPLSFTNYSLPVHSKSRAGPVRPDRRNRTKFTPEQLDYLESEFQKLEFAVADRKIEIAKETGVPPRTIALWFQNRRAKQRRDQLKREQNFSGES